MFTRIASALIALPVVLYLIAQGGWLFGGLVFAVTAVCLVEFAGMVVPGDQPARALIVLLGLAFLLAAITGRLATPAGVAVAGLGFLALLLLFLFRTGPIETAAFRLGASVLGVLWAGGLMTAIAALRLLPDGTSWIILACILAWGSDTGAYFAGRFLGKHKLYEKVSPKKTWEGAVGGLIAATLLAYAERAVLGGPPIDPVHLGILSPIVAALGQMGDLAESLLKRSVGVKDSGKIMPGHGGLLDRVDALMFCAPAVLAYALIVEGLSLSWL